VKYFHDEEAKVVSAEKGKGRCWNMMGKLHCLLPNGVEFKVGTGFSDKDRKNPPHKGSIITFKYQELTHKGVPRLPVFLRRREDMSWDDVVQNAKTKVPFSQIKKKSNRPEKAALHPLLHCTLSRSTDGSENGHLR